MADISTKTGAQAFFAYLELDAIASKLSNHMRAALVDMMAYEAPHWPHRSVTYLALERRRLVVAGEQFTAAWGKRRVFTLTENGKAVAAFLCGKEQGDG